jgi:hypothetical protein
VLGCGEIAIVSLGVSAAPPVVNRRTRRSVDLAALAVGDETVNDA